MTGWRHAIRTGSLTITAAAALAAPCAAAAQPAPNAQPAGGLVVGGSATIGQTSLSTTVSQSSQRAAITWQSFDVGSQQTVQVSAPSASAVTLMQVVGPNPSQVAGRISSNGIVVITNVNGAALDQGAQVNASSFVLSAPGAVSKKFMAGGAIVFNQASSPTATIANAGTITIQQAGMATLLARAVANQGTIDARLGSAWLLGAQTATVGVPGSAGVSFKLTKAVSQAPPGVSALITQTGTISAPGGSVQIMADAVPGVIQTLSSNLGVVNANTVGSTVGTISIGGTGGSINVGGRVQALGGAFGAGGSVELLASGSVTLGTAAKVNVSGGAGGGTLAVGTTAARAAGGPPVTGQATSQNVTVPSGAALASNATKAGNGGHITMLSTQTTRFAGSASAVGGPNAGNGGVIEISGSTLVLPKSATTNVSAPKGQVGSVLLDPRELIL
jgi:filamentous hemagglutinin family protein